MSSSGVSGDSAGVGSSEPELADAASSGVRTSSPARSHGGVWIFARGDGGGGSAAAADGDSASSAVRAVLLQIRRAHWRWSAALSLFAAGVLFATQYGTLEGVRRVMSDGYVTRAASLASTSPTAAFASRASAP